MKQPTLFPDCPLHGDIELKRRELIARRDRLRERGEALDRERRQFEVLMRRCGGDKNARIADYTDDRWNGTDPFEGPWSTRGAQS